MTTQEMVDAQISVLENFLSVHVDSPGYSSEVVLAQNLLTVLTGYPWS